MPRLHSNAKSCSSRDAGQRSAPRSVIAEKMNRGERLAFSHLMSAAGRKWNAMDSGLLCTLNYGHKDQPCMFEGIIQVSCGSALTAEQTSGYAPVGPAGIQSGGPSMRRGSSTIAVEPRTKKARKAVARVSSYLLQATGRKWNAMNSEERHDLLLQEFPPCDATWKISIQRWQQLLYGTKLCIAVLLCRGLKESAGAGKRSAQPGAAVPHKPKAKGQRLKAGVA